MSGVEEYLSRLEEPQCTTLLTVRARLRTLLPEAEEVIAYGVPVFKVEGVGVAGYSASKKHCSYLPMSGTVLATLADQLQGFTWSKGALRFAIDEPLSEELLALLVKTRRAEIAAGKR